MVRAIALWIGQCTVLANHFPLPRVGDVKQVFVRDSEGMQNKTRKPSAKRKHEVVSPDPVPGDLSLCPRWAALRRRILDKAGVG